MARLVFSDRHDGCHSLIGGGKNCGRRGLGRACVKRRRMRILQTELQRFGQIIATQFGQHREREIDACRYTASSDDIPIAHHAPRIRHGPEQWQQMPPGPVTGRSPALTFTPGTDLRFSNRAAAPASLADCTYTPAAGNDPQVRHVCINPKGTLPAGSPGGQFAVMLRARIN